MEASGAGLSAGGDGTTAGDAGEGGTATATAPDAAAVQGNDGLMEYLQSFEQNLRGDLEAQRDDLLSEIRGPSPEQRAAQAAQEAAQQRPQVDAAVLDTSSPTYDPQAAAQALASAMQTEAERIATEKTAGVQKGLDDLNRSLATQDLVQKYPDLQKDDVAEALMKQAGLDAHAIGHPELAQNPAFWERTHLAMEGVKASAAQRGADGNVGTLEGGGGPGPGAAAQSASGQISAERLLGSVPKNPLPFG